MNDPAQLRQGLLDIWWSRDYTAYGQATGGDFSLTNWPVSETMSSARSRQRASSLRRITPVLAPHQVGAQR